MCWRDIQCKNKDHIKDFEWLKELKQKEVCPKQSELGILVREAKERNNKMGPNSVHGHWSKLLGECHARIAAQTKILLDANQVTPKWLITSMAVMCL